jgi:hypothetical protein
MRRPRRIVIAWVPIILALYSAGCSTSRFPPGFEIVPRPNAKNIVQAGKDGLVSSCARDEQLLGGGYSLQQGARGLVTITGSYPSSNNTWTVTYFKGYDPTGEYPLVVVAYCLKAPGLDVAATTTTVEIVGPQAQFWNGAVICPSGTTLTGGGYKTDVPDPPFNNAFVMASSPYLDVDHNARGWWLGQGVPPGWSSNVRTMLFARCAKNLPGAIGVVMPLAPFSQPPAYHDLEVACADGTFSTAGGYSLLGNGNTPRTADVSFSADDFRKWRASVKSGNLPQPGGDPNRPCVDQYNPGCARDAVIALCVPFPASP